MQHGRQYPMAGGDRKLLLLDSFAFRYSLPFSKGKIVGIVLIFRHVTQQRALEAALKSNERLALAGRLSASIAHEIHNPLDTVGNVLFLLGQEVGTHSKARELIAMAQDEVQRVTGISKNMLSLHGESRTASKVNLFAFAGRGRVTYPGDDCKTPEKKSN